MSGIINSAGSRSGVIGTTEIDYEEGIFTPTVLGTWSSNPTGLTGKYTKIGRTVNIYAFWNNGAKSGAYNGYLGGLPFTSIVSGAGSVVDGGVVARGSCLMSSGYMYVTATTFGVNNHSWATYKV